MSYSKRRNSLEHERETNFRIQKVSYFFCCLLTLLIASTHIHCLFCWVPTIVWSKWGWSSGYLCIHKEYVWIKWGRWYRSGSRVHVRFCWRGGIYQSLISQTDASHIRCTLYSFFFQIIAIHKFMLIDCASGHTIRRANITNQYEKIEVRQ